MRAKIKVLQDSCVTVILILTAVITAGAAGWWRLGWGRGEGGVVMGAGMTTNTSRRRFVRCAAQHLWFIRKPKFKSSPWHGTRPQRLQYSEY